MVTETAITKKEEFGLALTQYDPNDIGAQIAEMLGGEEVDGNLLPTLTVPGAGSTIWEMPETDDAPHAAEVEGVIIHWAATRAYYTNEYGDDDNSTPDCFSRNSFIGIGNPGGECKVCPMNEWNSARTGGGKACKERRMVYILRENSLVPIIIQIPSASIRAFKAYILSMLDRGGAKFANTTRFGLRSAKAGNRTYSQITLTHGRKLPTEHAQIIRAYKDTVIPAIEAQSA